MVRFVSERLVQMFVTLLLLVTFIFVAVTMLPGDPVRALFGFRAPPPEYYNAIVAQFHLDRPLLIQYALFVADIATGDFGRSFPANPFGRFTSGPLVSNVVRSALPVSARIVLGALAIQALVGITAGTWSALHERRKRGAAVYAGALVLVSIPVLVFAYVSRTYLSVKTGWFPSAGIGSGNISYVLPALSLAALSTGYVALLARSELLDVLHEPYIQAARARGLSAGRVIGIHALKNSLVPVVTILAANVGQLVTGLIIVEGVFSVPGVGGTVFFAIRSRDRALLVGLVIVIGIAVVVANTIADLLYAVIDPRIRLRKSGAT